MSVVADPPAAAADLPPLSIEVIAEGLPSHHDRVSQGESFVPDGLGDIRYWLRVSAPGTNALTSVSVTNLQGAWNTTPDGWWGMGVTDAANGAPFLNASNTPLSVLVQDRRDLFLYMEDNGSQIVRKWTFDVTVCINRTPTNPGTCAVQQVQTQWETKPPPENVTAITSGTSATITWQAPDGQQPGGASYVVAANVTAADVLIGQAPPGCLAAFAEHCTVTGLRYDRSYTFVVRLDGGQALSSEPSAPVWATGPPLRPDEQVDGQVQVTPGDASAIVTWPPFRTRNTPVTGYTVTATLQTGGPLDSVSTRTCATTGATSCQLVGLLNGLYYAVTVVAHSAAGDSDPAYAFFTPVAPPLSPQLITSTAGDKHALISWHAAVAQGAAVTGYMVRDRFGPQGCSTTSAGATPTSCSVPGLTNGRTYYFEIQATSSSGPSAWAQAPPVTPNGPPDAPTDVTASPGHESVTVAWTAAGGHDHVTGYQVRSGNNAIRCSTTAATTCTFAEVPGFTNTYMVIALSENGPSLPSAPTAEVAAVCTPDAQEPNDTRATAFSTFSGDVRQGAICGQTDIDQFSMVVGEGEFISVMITYPTALGDLALQLRDEFGNPYGDSMGTNGIASFDSRTLPAGTYYISVAPTSQSFGGSYELTAVRAAPSGPTPPLPEPACTVLAPVRCDGTATFRLGSTIPVKFLAPELPAGASFSVTPVGSQTPGPVPQPVAPSLASGVYKLDAGQHLYNFSTKGLKAGNYRVRLTSGSVVHEARLSLR